MVPKKDIEQQERGQWRKVELPDGRIAEWFEAEPPLLDNVELGKMGRMQQGLPEQTEVEG